ncbi:MAG: MBOAT family protein, partial [Armatimonadetes bacterium]|nr:MBOAT family protein [Armatimonadota bacterium]
QIYNDFAGYSDIAIGSALLFGIRVPENFLQPYFAMNIADFWRRWHVSLYRWIVDYVFIPLGGSRRGLVLTCVNTVLALLVSGLWHGAAWHFVAWGLYHGLLLVGYRLFRMAFPEGFAFLPAPVLRATSWGLTFGAVTVGWVLFLYPLQTVAGVVAKLL